MHSETSAIPGFLPGVAISILVGIALAGPVGAALRAPRWVGFVLVSAFGTIVAATLTPSVYALDAGATGSGTCDFGRIGLASIREVLRFGDTGLNVLLFVPLGFAIGFVPRSRRKAALVVGALVLPLVIEAIQLTVPVLDRACQSADVIDNLTGLVIGLAIGVIGRRLSTSTADDPVSEARP